MIMHKSNHDHVVTYTNREQPTITIPQHATPSKQTIEEPQKPSDNTGPTPGLAWTPNRLRKPDEELRINDTRHRKNTKGAHAEHNARDSFTYHTRHTTNHI
jgi:hypothetical protein